MTLVMTTTQTLEVFRGCQAILTGSEGVSWTATLVTIDGTGVDLIPDGALEQEGTHSLVVAAPTGEHLWMTGVVERTARKRVRFTALLPSARPSDPRPELEGAALSAARARAREVARRLARALAAWGPVEVPCEQLAESVMLRLRAEAPEAWASYCLSANPLRMLLRDVALEIIRERRRRISGSVIAEATTPGTLTVLGRS